MALEINTHDLGELKRIAETQLSLMTQAEKDKAENLSEIKADLDKAIDAYAKEAKAQCFKDAKDSGNAMVYACTTYFYDVLAVKDDKDELTDEVIGHHLEKVKRPIDLGELYKKLSGIGSDKNWIYTAEKLNYHLTYRAADRMGAKTLAELLSKKSDCFYMNEISRKVDLGANPVSNTNLLKTLQTVITQMLGDEKDEEGKLLYKCTSHDVNYLVDVYANDNKKSKTGITAANHKTLRTYLKKVCHRILTNGDGYDVEQREIKSKD